jgi:hypothetical protein
MPTIDERELPPWSVSDINPEPVVESGLRARVQHRLSGAVNWLLDQSSERTGYASADPVSDEVLGVARFIVADSEMNRLSHVVASSLAIPRSRLDRLEDVTESMHSQRYDRDATRFGNNQQPSSILEIVGRGYEKHQAIPNGFFCNLGVFPLSSGLKVVQAVPFAWEGPSFGSEYRSMQETLHELFGGHEENDLKALEEFARINLAVVDGNGHVDALRPFNPKAFGSDFLAILDKMGQYNAETDLDLRIQVQDNRVMDFNKPSLGALPKE